MTQPAFDLRMIRIGGRRDHLQKRVTDFYAVTSRIPHTYFREVVSPMDREVLVREGSGLRKMLMFASNNYLGFANHPDINAAVINSIRKYGCGVAGPPLLNGYHTLIRETEAKLAAFKKQEDAMIFSSGFTTNLGIVAGLAQTGDTIIYDERSHASFYDGMKAHELKTYSFPHNQFAHMESLMAEHGAKPGRTLFASVEGVYSMDGDCAPLDEFTRLCKLNNAVSIVDDAHGTGVLGLHGTGTAEHFQCSGDVDVHMGTFSKAFAVSGGFVAANKEIINYLRYFARPYMFSASLALPVAAAVSAGIDLIRDEPWRREALRSIVAYAAQQLEPYGLFVRPEAGFITLRVPEGMQIRRAARAFHNKDIFLNAIEYPAVEQDQQRFRISFTANHSREDIDRLTEVVLGIWNDPQMYLP